MKRLPQELLHTLGMSVEAEVISLPGNENENQLVSAGDRSFVVKKLRGHTAANTELENIYRHYLADAGLPVTSYVSLDNTSCVHTVDKDSYVAIPYVQGAMPTPDARVASETGAFMAKVHSLRADIMPRRQNWYDKNYVPDSLDLIDNKYASAKAAFAAQFAAMPDFWDGSLPKGIIHGDLQEENIIVDAQGKIVSVIDWEEAGVEPLLLDVAHSAQQLSFEQGICRPEIFNAFVGSYQNLRSLTDKEKELFDAALRYTMLVLSVWVHIKMSRGEVGEELFQRVGNYYRASYKTPRVG